MGLRGLQPAQLQHVVQKAQQLGAGRLDPLQVLYQLLFIVQMPPGQGGEAHHGVQRRAHVVGDIGQEGVPGVSRLLRLVQGLLQDGGALPLPADLLVHRPAAEHNLGHALVGADVDNEGLYVLQLSLAEDPIVDMIGFTFFQRLPDVGRGNLLAEALPVLRADPAVRVLVGEAGEGPDLQIAAKAEPVPGADPVGLDDVRLQIGVEHRLVVRAEALDQLQPADQLVVHLLQELQVLLRLLLKLFLQKSGPLGGPAAVALRGVGQEDVKHAPQAPRLDEVAEVLRPADGPVLPDNAVLHIVQVEAVLGNLLLDALFHLFQVIGVDHALEGAAGVLQELLLRSAAVNLVQRPVDIEDLPVLVPVNEKAAGHLVGKALNLPGGQALPVPEVPAGGKQIFNQARIFKHGAASLSGISLYHTTFSRVCHV